MACIPRKPLDLCVNLSVEQEEVFRSRFASMKTKAEYAALSADVQKVARKHKLSARFAKFGDRVDLDKLGGCVRCGKVPIRSS